MSELSSKQRERLDHYLSLEYPVLIVKESPDCFFAEIPALPGCMTQAETLEEVYSMIEDARRAWLTVAVEGDFPINEPSDTSLLGERPDDSFTPQVEVTGIGIRS
jgi:antitoxin HicB